MPRKIEVTVNTLHILRKLAEQQQFAALKDACLAGDVADPAVSILLALALAHLGEYQEAENLLAGILPIADTLDPDARVDLAGVLMLRLATDEAIAHLEAVLEQTPDHALALGACRT
uniref:Tetratricopeptide repeat-containing protein n=1 Tax=Candidatus Kentrum sp. DK TaxID=2126562 RepID=A0A450T871_9GAMM|nr:MAG: hypothetical protein BECKDK2373C_GA0170839_11013 [Candidatus Kentron sp. DK]